MAIATNDRGSRKGKALLGSDDMYNTLAFVPKPKICKIEFFDIFFERKALNP